MKQRKIWLVWCVKKWTSNPTLTVVDLRAVDESEKIAEIHKEMILKNENPEQAWIEPRVTNHCYGFKDIRMAIKLQAIPKNKEI